MTTLAELRQASLQEQKDTARDSDDVRAREKAPASDKPAPLEPEHAPTRSQTSAQAAPGPAPVRLQVSTHDEPEERAPRPRDGRPAPPALSADFIDRVHAALGKKTIYPTGTKATVDMAPALFHRAKRYCLDHGNITLRQVFLDLLTEFLAEEGY